MVLQSFVAVYSAGKAAQGTLHRASYSLSAFSQHSLNSHVRLQPLISTIDPPTQSRDQALNERLSALLSSCVQGDEVAFEELYSLSSARLFGVVMRILRIEAVAEEALQDSYIKIWQKAATYEPTSGSPMAWMHGIARHQALDLLRRRGSRENNELTDVSGYIDAAADLRKPLHEMTDDASVLMQCLDRLPEESRRCIVRAYCEGYSHEELASHVDSPIGTIKSWIRRGLISLRKCIDEYS